MTRTQIQLPDDLYWRAKAFAARKEISLAEVTRRGLEVFLDRFPEGQSSDGEWKLPVFDGGESLVPLEKLKDFYRDDEMNRSLPKK
jgi:hypothetical protein